MALNQFGPNHLLHFTLESSTSVNFLSHPLSVEKTARSFQVLKNAGAEVFDFTCLEMRLGA